MLVTSQKVTYPRRNLGLQATSGVENSTNRRAISWILGGTLFRAIWMTEKVRFFKKKNMSKMSGFVSLFLKANLPTSDPVLLLSFRTLGSRRKLYESWMKWFKMIGRQPSKNAEMNSKINQNVDIFMFLTCWWHPKGDLSQTKSRTTGNFWGWDWHQNDAQYPE